MLRRTLSIVPGIRSALPKKSIVVVVVVRVYQRTKKDTLHNGQIKRRKKKKKKEKQRVVVRRTRLGFYVPFEAHLTSQPLISAFHSALHEPRATAGCDRVSSVQNDL